MRRGSFSERFLTCGKANCACHKDQESRHGPYYSVVRVVDGKTKSIWVKPEAADLARAQVGEGARFRRRIDENWTACETWADEELKVKTEAVDRAEKRGSKRAPPRSKEIDRLIGQRGFRTSKRSRQPPAGALWHASRVLERRLN
jgi:hypothetical protein